MPSVPSTSIAHTDTAPPGPERPPSGRAVRLAHHAVFVGPLALGVFVVYLATMAPTVTWRNGGSDGAELAAAAYTWGVAHPPGYPLYLTLVRLVQFLPVGDLAYRAALFSAGAATAAVALVYAATLAVLGPGGARATWHARAGALYAAAAFAFGPLLWSQAVVAEVYTLGAALFGLFLLAAARWLARPARGSTLALTGSLALLASHQPPFAVALLPLTWLARGRRLPPSTWLLAAALLLLAPLLLLTLWARASLDPPLSWGDPSTPGRWLAHVTAAAYRGYLLARPLPDELPRVPYAAALLVRQLGWSGIALAALGLAWLWEERRAFAVLVSVIGAFFAAFAVLYNAQDGEIYLLPTVQMLALAAGVGAAGLLGSIRAPVRAGVAALLAASVAWQVWAGWPEVDASRDRQARNWGEATLQGTPVGGLVRSRQDEQTFVLWYLQAAEGLRPDVAIVDDRLLAAPWYRQQLLRRYPQLVGQGVVEHP